MRVWLGFHDSLSASRFLSRHFSDGHRFVLSFFFPQCQTNIFSFLLSFSLPSTAFREVVSFCVAISPPFPVSGRFRACVCVCVFACPRRLYGELCDEWHTGKHAYERSVFFLLYLLSFLGSLLAPHNDDGLCSAVENRVGVEETTSTKSWFVSVVPARRADIRIPCCSFLCSCWTSTLLIHRLFLPPRFVCLYMCTSLRSSFECSTFCSLFAYDCVFRFTLSPSKLCSVLTRDHMCARHADRSQRPNNLNMIHWFHSFFLLPLTVTSNEGFFSCPASLILFCLCLCGSAASVCTLACLCLCMHLQMFSDYRVENCSVLWTAILLSLWCSHDPFFYVILVLRAALSEAPPFRKRGTISKDFEIAIAAAAKTTQCHNKRHSLFSVALAWST